MLLLLPGASRLRRMPSLVLVSCILEMNRSSRAVGHVRTSLPGRRYLVVSVEFIRMYDETHRQEEVAKRYRDATCWKMDHALTD